MKPTKAITALQKRIKAQQPKPRAAKPLNLDEQRRVVGGFIRLIEGLYAHLPGKRAMYGHDPVQRLRSLQQHLEALDQAEFHRSMAEIVTELRDAHTRYIGPTLLQRQVAFLPILVERYGEGDDEHYLISHLFAADDRDRRYFADKGFAKGVEVTHWNGVKIRRAVERYADLETGGRPDARRARALESLTFRPLRYALLPDEEWVDVSFSRKGGRSEEVRLKWRFVESDDSPKVVTTDGAAQLAYAGDPLAETVRRVKKMLFATDKWHEVVARKLPTLEASFAASEGGREWFTGDFQDAVAARVVSVPGVGEFGLLRLWSFDLRDDDAFIEEVMALLAQLPRTGLIIDLRGNPGGLIWAAERLLQLFTPSPVEPARFSILATDLTRAMVDAEQNRQRLAAWRRSLGATVVSGELYSRAVPLTPPERCNDIGQEYPGPVVGVVDANTYSAGDLFAAGLVDNRIGTLVSVDEATGGGGANVWYSNNVAPALEGTATELDRLPQGIDYTIAFRRAVRVGDVAGTGIEDLGISGHLRRTLTKRDLTESNVDLFEFCGRLLASEPLTDMTAEVDGDDLKITTTNLDRVDLYVDGHPVGSLETGSRTAAGAAEYRFEAPWYRTEVIGFRGDIRKQQRLLRPAGV